MKAEIHHTGMLFIIPENETENFAIDKWFERLYNGCSYITKALDLRQDIGYVRYVPKENEDQLLKKVEFSNTLKSDS
jgi:hypothetical protein